MDDEQKAFRLGYLQGFADGHDNGKKADPVTEWLAQHTQSSKMAAHFELKEPVIKWVEQTIKANKTFDDFATGSGRADVSQNAEIPKSGGGDA
jgi:hypothetical protein